MGAWAARPPGKLKGGEHLWPSEQGLRGAGCDKADHDAIARAVGGSGLAAEERADSPDRTGGWPDGVRGPWQVLRE